MIEKHYKNRNVLGIIGVISFHLTLSITRKVISFFDATIVGLSRTGIAEIIPTKSPLITAIQTILAFPLLST
ncbi:hypothetical protein [Bacillus cereus]|uniref:hypothetical protein n=1 Tax=Bacillus cereus group TaxID=86661 RepID=UPI000BEBB8FD|nr:hypothetical protein [Bacillus cereus]PEE11062.1 hypothetical protein CON52_16325 [Bacillus cereus]PFV36466.1 hypothetical protein COL01_05710 [Bacillus thuringiensis]HDR4743902.1 hypothetical protein [Bacillus cereus]HDR4822349.1 hypothetical protein [Bacillus cereus]